VSPPERLLALVAHGQALLARERELIGRGEFGGVADLAEEKAALLEALQALIREVHGSEEVRAALSALISESRRNERLLQAARQGIAGARRRIEAIAATKRGAVAYDRDGTPINSREDGVKESSRA